MTICIIFGIGKIMYNSKDFVPTKSPYRYSQRNIHYLVSPYIGKVSSPKIERQSDKHFAKTNLKVIIIDNEAYWVKDNTLYTARMTAEGVDKDTTTVVDTMNMDKVQLDKMLFIIDQLRDGKKDDRRGTGH